MLELRQCHEDPEDQTPVRGVGIDLAASRIGVRSILDPVGGAVRRPGIAPVIEPGRGDIGVPEPFLHLRDIGIVVQRIGRGRRTQAVGSHDVAQADLAAVDLDDGAIDGIGVQRPPRPRPPGQGMEQRRVRIAGMAGMGPMAGGGEPGIDALEGGGCGRHIADLAALAVHPQMQHPLAQLQVADPQCRQLGAAQPVIEQGGEDGAVAQPLQRVGRRRVEQGAGLGVTERRGRALAGGGRLMAFC